MGLKLCKALMIQFKSVPFQVPLNKRYAKAKGSFIPYMHENWWENRADFISVDICAWKHQFSCASVMFSIHTNVDVSFFFLCAENCIHVDPCAEKKICTWCQCSGVNMEHREQCFFFSFLCPSERVQKNDVCTMVWARLCCLFSKSSQSMRWKACPLPAFYRKRALVLYVEAVATHFQHTTLLNESFISPINKAHVPFWMES